jgi:phosphoglycerol transferase MdoB-like AlkP superfamily enzyme
LEYNTKGFIYSFIYNLNTFYAKKPVGYDTEKIKKLQSEYTLTTKKRPTVKPHIIIVQNESFTDIGLNPNLIFEEADKPLINYTKIANESISGYLTVPNFGGGTANTEYDVLTGCMTEDLANTNISSFRMQNRKMDTIAYFLKSQGYENLFMHPGDSWFYNRSNVYKLLGISRQIYGDSFKKPQDFKGLLVSDDAFANKIIKEFENHVKGNPDNPLFNFSVSIENHMPYVNGKYENIKLPQIKTRQTISKKSQEYLSNYIYGLRHADQSLAKLVNYFKDSKEPVILVFFGDHLPNLGENYFTYKEIEAGIKPDGNLDEIIKRYKVPFLIWENNALKSLAEVDKEKETLGLPKDKTISINYLGSILYKLLGYEGENSFLEFMDKMRREVPVIRRDFYGTGAGYSTVLSPEKQKLVEDYRLWEYYKVHEEEVKLR